MNTSPWTWAVIYDDGSQAFEADLQGFGRVDIDNVRMLVIQSNTTTQQYVTYIHDGMRPIFFRRKHQVVEIGSEQQPVPQEFATVFGWQKTTAGKNVKSLTFLLHDGSVWHSDCDIDEISASA